MTINVALVGVGNVASALVQGVEYYKTSGIKPIGILSEIKEYSLSDIRFKLAFDVNKNKVGLDLSEAIFVAPNCAKELFRPQKMNATTFKGPIMDGLDSDLKIYVPVDDSQKEVQIKNTLKAHEIDIVIILLPTGSNKAANYYAKHALEAGCAVINGMPSLIANNPEIQHVAEECKLPLIGDDVKSQIGATIVHRSLSNLFPMRGAILDRTIQLDWGGDMDFCNLTSNNRYERGKRQSKTESVVGHLPNKDKVEVQISAVDYIPFLQNQKEAYTRIEGRIFGGMPVRIDILMQVQDGYNSAGILVDMIRVAKIGKDRSIGGVLYSACSFFNKKPPIQIDDETAKRNLVEFIEGKRDR